MSAPIVAGEFYRIKFPFVRCEVDVADVDGFATVRSWKPGVEFVPCGQYGEDAEAVCDAEGSMVLTVVDVHRPGKFPTRVFYTRAWIDPEGKMFGKGALRIITQQAFRRRIAGYAHEYRLRTADEIAEAMS